MAIQYLAMMLLGIVGGETATKAKVAAPVIAAPVVSVPTAALPTTVVPTTAVPTVDELPVPPSVVNLQLERAERDFSIQTFEQFHRNRAEYDRRMGMARSLKQQWVEAGANMDEQAKLAQWFEHAASGTHADLAADLPPAPRFVLVVQEHESAKELADDDDKKEKTDGKKIDKATAAAGSAAHVQSAGATSKAADTKASNKTAAGPVKNGNKTSAVEAESIPPTTHSPAASKSTVISSVPSKIGACVDRAFEELSGRSPAADSN